MLKSSSFDKLSGNCIIMPKNIIDKLSNESLLAKYPMDGITFINLNEVTIIQSNFDTGHSILVSTNIAIKLGLDYLLDNVIVII